MKCNLFYSALLHFLLFSISSTLHSQSILNADSLSVEWERLDGPPGEISDYAQCGNRMFAATREGIYTSDNEGLRWTYNPAWGRRDIRALWANDTMILAVGLQTTGSHDETELNRLDIWKSNDMGNNWSMIFKDELPNYLVGPDKPNGDITDFHLDNNHHISFLWRINGYGINHSRRYYSLDGGANWSLEDASVTSKELKRLSYHNGIYSGIWRANHVDKWRAYRCTNIAFSDFLNIPVSAYPIELVNAICFSDTVATFWKSGWIELADTAGNVWESVAPLPAGDSIVDVQIMQNKIYLRTLNGIWSASVSAPFNLTKVYNGEFASGSGPNQFYFTPSGQWVNTFTGQTIFRKNETDEWSIRSKGLEGNVVYANAICGRLVTGRYEAQYLNQLSFVDYSNTLDGGWKHDYRENPFLYPADNYLKGFLGTYAGNSYCYNGKLLRSPDCGESWDTIFLPIYAAITGAYYNNHKIYFFSRLDYKYVVANSNGDFEYEVETPLDGIQNIFINGDTIILLGGGAGLIRQSLLSYDNGNTWVGKNIWDQTGYNFRNAFRVGNTLVAITHTYENDHSELIFVSFDWGNTWLKKLDDLPPYAESGSYIFGTTIPLYDNNSILAHTNGGLYYSQNLGQTWLRITNVPFSKKVTTYFWHNPIKDFILDGANLYLIDDGYLYAFSEAQGIWRTDFSRIQQHALVKEGKYGYLHGRVFRDSDYNCSFDPANGDVPFDHRSVTIQPGNVQITTNYLGEFNAALPVGTYTVSTVLPQYHSLYCGSTAPVNINSGQTIEKPIVLRPDPGITDLYVYITPAGRARPGFDVRYTVQVYNAGTTPVFDGMLQLTFNFNHTWLTPLAVLPAGQFSGDQVIAPVGTLAPGASTIFYIDYNVRPETPLGTLLSFTANCPATGDVNPNNNTSHLNQTVSGSYDPNDKTAFPVAPELPGVPRVFDYLIRFQNTGTDTAFNVVVTDTLDARFDSKTLHNIESSHTYTYRILDNNIIKWVFKNILLPDSNTNEIGSHGFIRFQISTLPNALPDSAIWNKAAIYFDFNQPVITNQTETIIPKWMVQYTHPVTLCAGDYWNGTAWTQSSEVSDTLSDVWTDTIHLYQLNVHPVWEIIQDTSILSGALFLNNPMYQDTIVNIVYQTDAECDSTVIWHIRIETTPTSAPEYEKSFSIAPNPAQASCLIRAKNTALLAQDSPAYLTIVNAAGVPVLSLPCSAAELLQGYRINLSTFSAGVYWLKVQAGKGVWGGKFTVIR